MTLNRLEEIRVPRWLFTSTNGPLHLIGYSDASFDDYAAVIYSRVKVENQFKITLVASRARVTPLKTKKNLESNMNTIPKFELESLLLLTELYQEVIENFKHHDVKFTAYTDSQICLCWIRGNKDLDNKMVKRRVNKIKKILKPADIHYVPSAQNPADHGSRGLSPAAFVDCDLWHSGPDWLKDEPLRFTPFDCDDTTYAMATLSRPTRSLDTSQPNFSERFSNYVRLVKAVARILRWKCNRIKDKEENPKKFNEPLTAEEVENAKVRLFKMEQARAFSTEIDKIRNNKALPSRHWLACLTPYLDEENGLLRVGGRLSKSLQLSHDTKHPILLPKKSHLTELIIRSVHEAHGHPGQGHTARLLRETLWIPSTRDRVKKVVRSCTTCIRWRGDVRQQQMADLPASRFDSSIPFSTCGLDYAGPYHVRASKIKFDRTIKIWIAIFVDFSCKGVHIEVVDSLSADSFLACFSRFTNRRGCPKILFSDNASTFMAAANQMEDSWNKCLHHFALENIEWKNIPVAAPSFGGLWEAAVKSFKHFEKRSGGTIAD